MKACKGEKQTNLLKKWLSDNLFPPSLSSVCVCVVRGCVIGVCGWCASPRKFFFASLVSFSVFLCSLAIEREDGWDGDGNGDGNGLFVQLYTPFL